VGQNSDRAITWTAALRDGKLETMRTHINALAFLFLFMTVPVWALAAQESCMDPSKPASNYYMTPAEVDLVHVLGPPPAIDSPEGKADLQAVLNAQRTRTAAQVESARNDGCLSIFRFADAMGPGFKPENLKFTVMFFERTFYDDQHAVDAAKKYFKRPRPFVSDSEVSPLVKQAPTPSYPSGHATFAYVTAILLADMVPDKGASIFERSAEYSYNRVVAGVHYPSDVEAGRIAGSVIDNVLLHNPQFEADLARATIEVRHAIGLK
jgi:acid phosphatase (class A)